MSPKLIQHKNPSFFIVFIIQSSTKFYFCIIIWKTYDTCTYPLYYSRNCICYFLILNDFLKHFLAFLDMEHIPAFKNTAHKMFGAAFLHNALNSSSFVNFAGLFKIFYSFFSVRQIIANPPTFWNHCIKRVYCNCF